jgi:acetyl-CoA synthetase
VWVHGDWARIDEDGYWYVTGRSDDTLNIAGKRIGPSEIEAAAIKNKSVGECAAIGVSDELKGTVIWCFCVLNGDARGDPLLADDIKATVASELGKAFRPAVIKFVPELPKTRSGKVLRRLIRAYISGEPQGDLSTLENPQSIAAIESAIRA